MYMINMKMKLDVIFQFVLIVDFFLERFTAFSR